MINVRFRPLTQQSWPGPSTARRVRGPFKGLGLPKILRELERELRHLRARDIVIAAFIPAHQIRQDGFPYANARASSPGIVLEFVAEKTRTAHRFFCDRYLFWEDNLIAVTRALEALRMIDRYGVNRGGEQYAGYRALPQQTSESENNAVHSAATVLASFGGGRPAELLTNVLVARDQFRIARSKSHPDRGGSHDAFIRVTTAGRVLGAYFGEDLS